MNMVSVMLTVTLTIFITAFMIKCAITSYRKEEYFWFGLAATTAVISLSTALIINALWVWNVTVG